MSGDDATDANPCFECGGKCCSFHGIRISYRDLDACQRYDSMLLDRDPEVLGNLLLTDGTVPDMDWYTIRFDGYRRALAFDCNHLQDDGTCGVYDRRPGMCRSFECPALDDEDDTTLDEFLDMVGWEGTGEEPEDTVDREVTERVREIIGRDGVLPDDLVDAHVHVDRFAESGAD